MQKNFALRPGAAVCYMVPEWNLCCTVRWDDLLKRLLKCWINQARSRVLKMGCGKKQVQLKLHGRGVFFPQTIPDSNHFCSTHIEQWDSSVLLNPLIVGQRLTFGLQKVFWVLLFVNQKQMDYEEFFPAAKSDLDKKFSKIKSKLQFLLLYHPWFV